MNKSFNHLNFPDDTRDDQVDALVYCLQNIEWQKPKKQTRWKKIMKNMLLILLLSAIVLFLGGGL